MAFRYFLAGIIVFCCYHLINSFISLWLGSEYILENSIVVLLMIYVFIMITRGTVDMFNTAFGLYADTWAAWTEVILNVGITLSTAFYLGINGILLGKIISTSLIIALWKPYYLFPGDCELLTCCIGKNLPPSASLCHFICGFPFYQQTFSYAFPRPQFFVRFMAVLRSLPLRAFLGMLRHSAIMHQPRRKRPVAPPPISIKTIRRHQENMKSTPPRFSIVTINLNNRAGLEKPSKASSNRNAPIMNISSLMEVLQTAAPKLSKIPKLPLILGQRTGYRHLQCHEQGAETGTRGICLLSQFRRLLLFPPGSCRHAPGGNRLRRALREGNNGRRAKREGIPAVENNTLYFIIKNFCHQAAFMRTRLCHKHQFDETYKICADRKMLLSLLFQESATFKPINAFIAYFDATGISHTAATTMLEEDARSLKETLPAAILDDYRLLLASPIAPYYMDMLVNFKTPRKIQLFPCPHLSGRGQIPSSPQFPVFRPEKPAPSLARTPLSSAFPQAFQPFPVGFSKTPGVGFPGIFRTAKRRIRLLAQAVH